MKFFGIFSALMLALILSMCCMVPTGALGVQSGWKAVYGTDPTNAAGGSASQAAVDASQAGGSGNTMNINVYNLYGDASDAVPRVVSPSVPVVNTVPAYNPVVEQPTTDPVVVSYSNYEIIHAKAIPLFLTGLKTLGVPKFDENATQESWPMVSYKLTAEIDGALSEAYANGARTPQAYMDYFSANGWTGVRIAMDRNLNQIGLAVLSGVNPIEGGTEHYAMTYVAVAYQDGSYERKNTVEVWSTHNHNTDTYGASLTQPSGARHL